MRKPDFLETSELTEQQALDMMNLGVTLKACVRAGYYPAMLKKKCVTLLTAGLSESYRLCLETAVYQLGGHLSLYGGSTLQEELRQTARDISRTADLAIARFPRHETLLLFAKYADVPVLSAGSNHSHPIQEIADLITMFEHLPPEKKLEECKAVYQGPACAKCASVLFATSKIGMQFVQLCADKKQELQPPVLKMAERNVKKSGGAYAVTDSAAEAFHGAHFLFMDAPLGTKLPPEAEGILRVDPEENLLAALRSILVCMLYENPAAREPILIEKMKRMLAMKLQAIFGFGDARE